MLPAHLHRAYATATNATRHRVLIVGGGTAGVTVAAQLQRSKKLRNLAGLSVPRDADIAIVDPASEHHYQVRSVALPA